jgi:ribosome recycling factor
MQAADVLKSVEEQMKKAVSLTQKELQAIRTGRANPGLLDRVVVDYYGAPTPLKQVANISTPDGKCLVIQPYDKSSLKDIEIAINKSDTGMTPNNDGNVIRIVVPALTEERRKSLVKDIKKIAEDNKVSVRNARRDALESVKKLEKDKAISEDQSKKEQEHIQKFTDKYSKEIDELTASKEKEVMVV